jgi:hypothetical protein
MPASTANIGSDRNDAPQIFTNTVTVNGALTANGGVTNTTGAQSLKTTATNGPVGVATLSGGTVTVANTAVTANTAIFLGRRSVGGTAGALFVSAITAGTSFVITSTSGTDTSVVAYQIVTLT